MTRPMRGGQSHEAELEFTPPSKYLTHPHAPPFPNTTSWLPKAKPVILRLTLLRIKELKQKRPWSNGLKKKSNFSAISEATRWNGSKKTPSFLLINSSCVETLSRNFLVVRCTR